MDVLTVVRTHSKVVTVLLLVEELEAMPTIITVQMAKVVAEAPMVAMLTLAHTAMQKMEVQEEMEMLVLQE